MADYKIVDADTLDSALNSLADSIRTKSGVTGELVFPEPNEFKSAVDSIQTIINGTNPTKITSNGIHVTGGYSGVEVEVPSTIPDGYVFPTEIIYITSNVSNMDITMGKTLNVNVQPSSDYIKLNKYYTEQYTPSGTSLVLSKTFTCGFSPKVILIVPNTDTTFSTTNSEIFSAYITLGSLELRRKGLYKLSTSNRVGVSSGGIGTPTSTGFTYSHNIIGFKPGVAYDVYVWGEG